jgi:hypothetical protein
LRGRRTARTLIALAVLWSAWPSRAAEIPFGARNVMTVVRPDVMTIVRADDSLPVVVDGRLDEPIWQDLPAISDFVVIEPDTLQKPPHATRVRLFYTSRGLYVGFELEQPPETLLRRLSSRDAGFQVTRDEVSFTLDTSGEGRYGFWFNVALGGSHSDGTILPERQYSSNWDGPWYGVTQITATGWSAEFFIPWGTVAMPSTGPTRQMGLYMSRRVGYRDERWAWPALPPTKPKFMSVLQPIAFENVAPRQQYSVYPFIAATWDEVRNDMDYRAGGDLIWHPTTNSQVMATLYPDFAAVDTDDLIVNLTATETFFPEKRLFFLEGQEVFVATPRAEPRNRDVGDPGAPYTMVNTRRIGGAPRTPIERLNTIVNNRDLVQPVDLLGAAKVTGQAGALRYGLLAAAEDDVVFHGELPDGTNERWKEPGDDYGIARLLYEATDDGAYGALGWLSTAVDNPNREAFAHGVDGHYLSPTGQLRIDGQIFTSDVTGENTGYGGFADFEYFVRQGVSTRVGIEWLDSAIDLNDLGYLARNDNLRVRVSHTRTVSDLGWAHENQFDIRGFVQENHESLFTGGGVFVADRLTFEDRSKLVTRVSFAPKSFNDIDSEGFGTFRVDQHSEASVRWDSNAAHEWGFGIGGGYSGEYLGGNTWSGEAQIDWRPSDRFHAMVATAYYDSGDWLLHQVGRLMATYDAKQWEPKLAVEYYITADQQFRTSLQWVGIKAKTEQVFLVPSRPGALVPVPNPLDPGDFSVSNLIFQARYRWEVAPLSEVFVVLTIQANQTRPLEDSTFETLFNDAFESPIYNSLVFKVRYRIGS